MAGRSTKCSQMAGFPGLGNLYGSVYGSRLLLLLEAEVSPCQKPLPTQQLPPNVFTGFVPRTLLSMNTTECVPVTAWSRSLTSWVARGARSRLSVAR
jgi:hypothetical protein